MTTRLRPQEPDEWSDEVREILGDASLNILRTIAHHAPLLKPFLGFTATLALRGSLPRRESELLALRAAWNCRSPFEWGHHVLYARAEGLSDEMILRVAHEPEHASWSGRDRLLLSAADELHRDQQLHDSTWGALRAEFDDAQLVEIPFVVGNYTMLSMVANATGVPLEPGLPELPNAG
ncbi:MAG: carboxymuconolactone decarboxylase family protein [Myxococcales bacterium]|nr:carboxymuconolactone decarboxylase family protein [Myxococcales bacterium]